MPDEFREMVQMIRQVELALGPSKIENRSLSQGAKLNKEILGKSLVYSDDLTAGTILDTTMIEVKSPGQGLPPSQIQSVIGKTIRCNVNKDDFLFLEHFSKEKFNHFFQDQPSLLWGVPVRPHDVFKMHRRFNAPVYEFHLSYRDLERDFPTGDWAKFSDKRLLVHAPELFENSELLNLCAEDESFTRRSRINLQKVIDFSNELARLTKNPGQIGIIANVGGFSTHEFKPVSQRADLYEKTADSLTQLKHKNTEILIQNMAPFPWHFGGQRYQNIFCDPDEILKFCKNHNTRICLDTSHLSMLCTYHTLDFDESFKKLLPVTSHFHMSDAAGLNGEGVVIGEGDVNFNQVIRSILDHQTFIVETWQGHKAGGQGFSDDLTKLEKLLND